VRDPKVHEAVIRRVVDEAHTVNWRLVGLTNSPVKGPEGNMEFLAHWKPGPGDALPDEAITEAVRRAHQELNP
jgi:23S rRNA (cytidine1920-2'-O)/16S rRNA (cytidine1409-2'-O)-methyltransferase